MLNLNTTGVTWSTLLPDHITSRTQSCYPFQNALNIGYNEKDMKDIVNTKFHGLQTDIWSTFCSQNDDSYYQYCHTSNYFTNFHSTIKYTVIWMVICPTQTGHVLHIIKLIRTVDGSKPRNFTYKPIYELYFTSSTSIHISLMNLSANIL